MATKVPAKREPKQNVIADFIPGTESFWTDGADILSGHDLLNNENGLLDALVGIPFLITALHYRASKYASKAVSWHPAVVAIECVIAPEDVLKRRRVDMSQLPWEPASQVVFNSSDTGIYRQLVEYLAAREFITLPEGQTGGSYGDSIYDLPPSQWTGINIGETSIDYAGFERYSVNIRLQCPRGIRISEYSNEFTTDGHTRYLA